MSAQDVELIRASYEALNRDDFDAWLELCHPDAEVHDLPEMPGTGIYRGHEGLRRWAESARELTADWHWELDEVEQAHNPYVIRVRVIGHGREGGVAIEQTLFHVFEMEEGRAAVIRGFLNREEAHEAARGPIRPR